MWAVKAINRVGTSVKTGLKETLSSMDRMIESIDFPATDGPNPAHEAAVYKEMLVDLQFEQVKTSREYQKVFAEQERKIRSLETQLGGEGPADAPSTPERPPRAPASSLSASALTATSSAATPSRKGKSADDAVRRESASSETEQVLEMREVLTEWEAKLKANIQKRTEAEAETRIQKETVEALAKQLRSLKEHVREQDTKLRRYGSIHEVLVERREGDEHAMDSLAAEYSKLSAEAEAQNQAIADLERLKASMGLKIEEQEKTIQLLVAGDDDGSSVTERSHADSPAPHAGSDDGVMSPAKLVADMRAATSAASVAEANSKSLEAELAATRKRVVDLTSALADAKGALAGNERRASIDWESDRVASLEKSLEEANEKLDERIAMIETLKSNLAAAEASASSSADGSSERIAELERKLEASRAEAQKRLDEQVAIREDAEEKLSHAEEASSAIVADLEQKLQASGEDATRRLEEEIAKRKAAEEKLLESKGDAASQADASGARIAALEARCAESEKALEEAKSRLDGQVAACKEMEEKCAELEVQAATQVEASRARVQELEELHREALSSCEEQAAARKALSEKLSEAASEAAANADASSARIAEIEDLRAGVEARLGEANARAGRGILCESYLGAGARCSAEERR